MLLRYSFATAGAALHSGATTGSQPVTVTDNALPV